MGLLMFWIIKTQLSQMIVWFKNTLILQTFLRTYFFSGLSLKPELRKKKLWGFGVTFLTVDPIGCGTYFKV